MHGNNLGRTIQEFAMHASVWNRNVFGHIGIRKRRVLARLDGIQQRLARYESRFLEELEGQLILEYNDILEQEELFWWQKSREK